MNQCPDCGKQNPADIHTCSPQQSADPYATQQETEDLLRLGKLPEALRLAEMLEKTMQWPLHGKAADELRRLHEENERLKAASTTSTQAQDDNDFLLGQACDLSGEGTCEACQ